MTKTRYERLLQYQAQEAAAGEEETQADSSEKNNNANSAGDSDNVFNIRSNGQPGAVSDSVSILQSCKEENQTVSVNSSNDSNGV